MEQIGRYRILGELGRGGMGIVYRGEDVDIGRPVAIKTLQPENDAASAATTGGDTKDRLRREAQAIGALSHPNIVMVYDLGQHDGMAYIVMEFIEGMTLERRLEAGPPLSIPDAIQILCQIAAALDYAHGRGVVHRDVKPANILLQLNGPAKITDFGIAKLASSQTKTVTGMVVGSANYMAPEQLKTQPVSGRTDQFALAVMAYQMLTGQKPFDADTLAALVTKILFQEPPPPQTYNTGLGIGVEQALRRAMSKEPAARFPTCTEFVDQLSAAVGIAGGALPPQARTGPERISGAQAMNQATAVISEPPTHRTQVQPVTPEPAAPPLSFAQTASTPQPVAPPPTHPPTAQFPPPYQQPEPPPFTPPYGSPQPIFLGYGGFWRRAWAAFIDAGIIWLVTRPFDHITAERVFFPVINYSLVSLVAAFFYESWFIKTRGATIGKRVAGLQVVMADGSPITWQVAYGRCVAKWLNYVTLGIGFFILVFDDQGRALEDRLCHTRVIRVPRKRKLRRR